MWDSQISFPDPSTVNMKYMILYHGCVMTVCVVVMSFVMAGFYYIIMPWYSEETFTKCYTKGEKAEAIWTGVPMIFLFLLSIPSHVLLYYSGSRKGCEYLYNLKVVGHQWYWSYEYFVGAKSFSFDSYMVPISDLPLDGYMFMDVDKRCVLPVNRLIRVLYTSVDVVHSWFIPSFGFKNDCIPGRIGSSSLVINAPGIYYGFCTELCGAYHSEMPIVVEAVPAFEFDSWLLAVSMEDLGEEVMETQQNLAGLSVVTKGPSEAGINSVGGTKDKVALLVAVEEPANKIEEVSTNKGGH
uniref:Cytochrome c oxidase subunit 2 n=1 Tax=Tridacna crocea TaxID=80833 RepID=A0A6B9P7W6_TRICC|nr:cytochrome c oxidase subunit II [Tridacna crocea]QHD44977.1 cytochrome c oxidase subunit II [Tridacna crocea]QRV60340.1 cytochrome oxidase subunit 2 [Tridacna crocea]